LTLKPGLSYHFHHFLWSGLDLLFPPSCGGCGKLGERWCYACQQKLEPVPLPICDVCGEPQKINGICPECQTTRPAFFALRSCVVFKEPARPALIKIKYHHEMGLGEALAWNIAVYLDELGWQANALIPIPLSEQRFAERGYNQVDTIAHPLARMLRWQYIPDALRRVRHTASQVGLSGSERRKNVLGVFFAETTKVRGKTILLLDDVTTTGATLNSASLSLLEAGAKKIYALTFAKALQQYGNDHEVSLSSRPLS
jgi:competence protein ComFC